jgi:hypothetical protein
VSNYKKVKAMIELHRYQPRTLFLRTAVGHGSLGMDPVELTTNTVSGEAIVRIGKDGPWYVVPWEPLVRAVAKAEGLL